MDHPAEQRRYAAKMMTLDPVGWAANRKEVRRRWRVANKDKSNAHAKVWRAVKAGRLIRPDVCEKCGVGCKPEAHHDDYDQPLAVEWLCRPCHAAKEAKGRD